MKRQTKQIIELLNRYSSRNYSLEYVCKLLGRKRETLMKYCRQHSLDFSDYTPRSMKNEV